MRLLNRFRDRMHPTPEEIADAERWGANWEQLIATDEDAAKILTIDPRTATHSLRVAGEMGDQIQQYVAVKHAAGQRYDGLWSSQ